MGFLRGVAPVVLLFLGACRGGEGAPTLSAIRSGDQIIVRGDAGTAPFATLSFAPPRPGDSPPREGLDRVAYFMEWNGDTTATPLAYVGPDDAKKVEIALPLADIPQGWRVVQWVTRPRASSGTPILGTSEPIYLWHHGDEIRIHGLWGYLWALHGRAWIGAAVFVLLLAILASRCWVPQRALARVVVGAALLASAIFLGIRVLAPTEQESVDSGENVPPLVITPSWRFTGDAEERVLGPGYRELAAEIRKLRAPGEALYFHIFDDELNDIPLARTRSSYLRREFQDGVIVFQHREAGRGVSVFYGSTPIGTVIGRCQIAVITRIEEAPK